MTYNEFMNTLEDFENYVYSEFIDNNGYEPIIAIKNDNNELKWYYCEDLFHDAECIPLNDVTLSKNIINNVVISYSERHENTLYYTNITEIDDKLHNTLLEYYNETFIDMYNNDIGWLLDEIALRLVFPNIFKRLSS